MKPNKDSASQPKSRDTRCHEHTTSHLKYKEEQVWTGKKKKENQPSHEDYNCQMRRLKLLWSSSFIAYSHWWSQTHESRPLVKNTCSTISSGGGDPLEALSEAWMLQSNCWNSSVSPKHLRGRATLIAQHKSRITRDDYSGNVQANIILESWDPPETQ